VAATSEKLNAKKREAVGTRACERIREAGDVPVVLYGHKEETLSLQVPYEELDAALRHHTRILELTMDAHKQSVLVKAVQYDVLGDDIIHADLLRVAMDEVIRLEVQVILKGTPKAEHSVLQRAIDAIEVECLPANIPESIPVNVADLQIGDIIHVSDLTPPAGVKFISGPETIVASLTMAEEEKAPEVAAPVEGAVEPEVIRQKLEEGEGAAEGEAGDAKKGEEKKKGKE
jgi:large subunit ribosomal protein L25